MNTTTKFTPGPWVAGVSSDGHVVSMGEAIQTPWSFASHLRWECAHLIDEDEDCEQGRAQFQESSANAHLIAAAPELYAVAEAALYLADLGSDDPVLVEFRDKARAALAKARGER